MAGEQHKHKKTYKSPTSKLLKFFEKSRDAWKKKCREAKRTVKGLKNRIRTLEHSREHWKDRTQELEAEIERLHCQKDVLEECVETLKKNEKHEEDVACLDDFRRVVSRQQYSVAHMSLFVTLVLSASASLRCASQALKLFLAYVPESLSSSSPCWVTGRFWLLRLGYYKLTRAKDISDDWVWIVDHSVQLGSEKCLVILGIRLSCLPVPFRSLRYEDMEPIELLPVKKSTGKIVYEQLEETIKKTGVPRQIVADEGSDLKKGIELFRHHHSETVCTYDIKHKTATLLKHELEKDEDWKEFSRLVSQTKQKVQQTCLSFLSPRNQRTKSRYMNADIIVEWGAKALHFLSERQQSHEMQDNEETPAKRECTSANDIEWTTLLEKVGWVRDFREQLKEWKEMINIIDVTEHFVRTQGFYHGASIELEIRLRDTGGTRVTQKLRAALLEFVAENSDQATSHETLVGSSEVLESLFGKFKDLEGDQAKSGFTGLLLSIPAMVSRTTSEVIQKAMDVVFTKNVLDWCKEYIGKSLQAKRREAFTAQGKKEQKWDKLPDAS